MAPPWPRSTMEGKAVRSVRHTPLRLTSMTCAQILFVVAVDVAHGNDPRVG